MIDDLPNNLALLPAGLRDLLPPEAEVEAAAVERLMQTFAAHGYQRVKPPLLEFEDSLLAGSGAAVAEQTFRIMDPDSQRMMGLRADTTPQVARLATTRLANAPRPLRLSYAGQCLRVRGTQLAPDRQVAQAGIELVGCDNPAADAEIVLVGAEALAAVGVERMSFDLTLPTLAPALLEEAGIEGPQRSALGRALDRKDAASVTRHGGTLAGVLDGAVARGGAGRPGARGTGFRRSAAGGAPARAATGGHGRGDPRSRAWPPRHRRSGGVPWLPLRDGRVRHDLRARPARGTRAGRPVHLRRGGAGDRVDAVSATPCCASPGRLRPVCARSFRSAPPRPMPPRCAAKGLQRSPAWPTIRTRKPKRAVWNARTFCATARRCRSRPAVES